MGVAGAGWLRTGALLALVLALDQLTKALVRADIALGESRELLPFLAIGHVHNRGVAFGLLDDGGALVLVIVFVALALLIGYFARHPRRRLLWLPTGLLLGGAIGNLVDRIRLGWVTDFIELPHWPSFNIADMAITVGVLALVVVLERDGAADDRRSREEHERNGPVSAD